MSNPLLIGADAGVVRVDRRFLVLQLDLSGTALRSFGGIDPFDGQAKPGLPGSFKFTDPLDWEDPTAPEYWRNILETAAPPGFVLDGNSSLSPYAQVVNAQFQTFKTNFLTAIDKGDVKLRRDSNGKPYRDITDLVRTVSGYSVSVDAFNNNLGLVLGSPNAKDSADRSLAFISYKGEKNTPSGSAPNSLEDTQALESTRADIGENDVIMVRTSRTFSNGKFIDYELEYLGFVSQVTNDRTYGALDMKTLAVSGISKLFSLSTIVKQAAIADPRFQANAAVNNLQGPSVFETLWQGKNIKQIVTELLDTVMAWKDFPQSQTATGAEQNQTAILFNVNKDQFTLKNGALTFQFNIFTLLTLYLMSQAVAEDNDLFPLPKPGTTLSTSVEDVVVNGVKVGTRPVSISGPAYILDKNTLGVIEHGDHKVWNEAVASGFENFFSSTTTPEEIFSDIRNYTYYDVFESRDGTIIVRPPRYNRIELSLTEYTRQFLDTKADAQSIEKILKFNTMTGNFEFNPSADYFIAAELSTAGTDVSREDTLLETRADTKWTMPYVGPVDFPAGAYQDPNLFIKYGLRTRGPVDNPNVINDNMATLFAPVVLGMLNAKTRKMNMSVRDLRTFRVGKLHYIESLKMVAFLISDEIGMGYGQIGVHHLGFSMVRKVVDVKISDILNSDNMMLNFALMYLKDPAPIAALSNGQATSMKKDLLARAKNTLKTMAAIAAQGVTGSKAAAVAANATDPGRAVQALADTAANNATIPMFRYIPTVLDVIVDIDDEPDKAQAQKTPPNTALKNINVNTDIQAVNLGGQLFATEIQLDINSPAVIPSLGNLSLDEFQKAATYAQTHVPDTTMSLKFFVDQSALIVPVGLKDSDWGIFNPRCAMAPYGTIYQPDQLPTSTPPSPLPPYIYNNDKVAQPIMSTPVYAAAISSNANSYAFSQVLVNRLALLDITMKYMEQGTFRKDYLPNIPKGFPQYYSLIGPNEYALFGSAEPPSAYSKKYTLFSSNFLSSIKKAGIGNPNALYYDGTMWKGECFQILKRGGVFNMPFGHIMVGERAPAGSYADKKHPFGSFGMVPKFARLSGGKYTFALSPGNKELVVTADPSDPKATVQWDDDPLPPVVHPLSSLPDPTLAQQATASTIENRSLTIPLLGDALTNADAAIFFLSPYMEPTVERLLEHGLPPNLAGYRTKKDVNNLIEKNPETKLLQENDGHTKGHAVDLCIEALVYDSQSDLQILSSVDTRFKSLAAICGFVDLGDLTKPPQRFIWIDKANNINMPWTYPDGTPGRNSPAPVNYYYHLGVTSTGVVKPAGDVEQYAARITHLWAQAVPPTGPPKV